MSRTYHHVPYKHRKFRYEFMRRVWLWSEPKEWRRTFKHKKRRAELRRAFLSRDFDNQFWPLDKKPWIYYY